MGNCLDSEPAHDDISLLRESNSTTQRDNSSDQLGPPHAYQVNEFVFSLPVNDASLITIRFTSNSVNLWNLSSTRFPCNLKKRDDSLIRQFPLSLPGKRT